MTRKDGPIGDDELDGLFGRRHWPLALAVSGGADSMALMHLIARWAGREDVKAKWAARWQRLRRKREHICTFHPAPNRRGLAVPSWLVGIGSFAALDAAGGPPRVVVLTVDHGLRPEAASEAAFVAEAAKRLGLPCEILRWQGAKPSTGIQEAAREARRELMLDCLRAEESTLVDFANAESRELHLHAGRTLVLAHHQEDQAETVLMRLARGSGLEGLAGMRPHSRATRGPTTERPTSFAAHVWRPLLDVPKQRLIDTLTSGGYGWIEDPSNADQRFERVRMRKALAALGDVGLTPEKIALSARRLGDAEDGVSVLLAEPPDGAHVTALMAEVPLASRWFTLPYLAVRSLRHLLLSYGGSAREAELAQVEGLAADICGNGARAKFSGVTLGGCKIEVVGEHHDRLRIYREGSGEGLSVVPLAARDRFEWDGGRYIISVQGNLKPGARLAALGLAGWASLKKAVPELAALGWPAAAAATLPAVMRNGEIADVPGLEGLLRRLAGDASPAVAAWRARQIGCEQGVTASFRGGRER